MRAAQPHWDAGLSRVGNVLLCRRPNDRPTTIPSPPARKRSSGGAKNNQDYQQLSSSVGSVPRGRLGTKKSSNSICTIVKVVNMVMMKKKRKPEEADEVKLQVFANNKNVSYDNDV